MTSNELFNKSIITLELPKVLAILAEKAVSEGAKNMARNLRPLEYAEDAERLMSQTSAAVFISAKRGSPSFRYLKDVSPSLARIDLGGILSMRELLEIAGILRNTASVKEYYFTDKRQDDATCLDLYFDLLKPNRYFEEKINSCILSEDEMADNASPELASIRRSINNANSRIRDVLQKMISSPSYSKYLQDNLITQRNGRYVLPVRSEHKGDMPGLVHDVSSSGQTLFIEPMPVVEANNEIQTLLNRESKEIERILYELSNEAAGFSADINANYRNLVLLDFIFAKAKLSYDMEAYPPRLSDSGPVRLIHARHPLILRDKVVPIDVTLGDTYDTLVITGPNTGGKTVSLKTLGLLSLMSACGLHIPASEESSCRVFKRIFADIGDEQSIEQSLSTFSSHMTHIVDILANSDEHTLSIYDELGAGTDPVEGAALAMAIIENTRARGSLCAATTHYAELKVFAMKTEGVENASCEFDVKTLRPTYRLVTGIPGRSNAFAIAGRIGLPDEVIEHAKELVAGENMHFEDLLDNLEQNRQQMEKEKQKAELLRREIEELSARAKKHEKEYEIEREKQLALAREEAKKLIEDTRIASDRLISELEQIRRRSSAVEAEELNRARTEAGTSINKMKENTGTLEKPVYIPPLPRKLRIGDTVVIVRTGTSATVLSAEDKNGAVRVQAGIMKINVKTNELRLEDKPKVKLPASNIKVIKSGNSSTGPSLDLRGMTAEEALLDLENYLDDAIQANLTSVTIIHGKGTGKLREAVHDRLRQLKGRSISSYRLGKYGEGETGVTIVEF